jgi:ribosomal protein L32
MRSANKGVDVKSYASCQTCQSPLVPHSVCKECGYYKGIKIVRTKTDRMHERGQERRAQQAHMQTAAAATPSADAAE